MKRLTTSLLLLSVFTVWAGCDDAPPPDDGAASPADRGKADGPVPAGTCEEACGDVSVDGCWCDEHCATYGDCCEDYEDVCESECAPVVCALACEEFQTDDEGCEICACAESDPEPVCEEGLCQLACEEFQTDEDGCEICACAEPEPSCEELPCQLACEEFQVDEDGCEICACAE